MDSILFQTASAKGPSLKSAVVLLVALDWASFSLCITPLETEKCSAVQAPAHCFTAYTVLLILIPLYPKNGVDGEVNQPVLLILNCLQPKNHRAGLRRRQSQVYLVFTVTRQMHNN